MVRLVFLFVYFGVCYLLCCFLLCCMAEEEFDYLECALELSEDNSITGFITFGT